MLARVALALSVALSAGAPRAADLSLTTPTGTLAGTITGPGKAPAILIIAGSGPTDRDGNSQAGVSAASYRLLAEGLAAQGITSLRADKRGVGASRAAMRSEADLRFGAYVDDAKAWAGELRRQSGAPCVWLLGHSEGALVAEVAAQDGEGQEGNGICGVILVSAMGRKMGDVIRAQMQANPANPPVVNIFVSQSLDRLEAGQTVADVPPFLASMFRPSVQPYLMSVLPLDPVALLAGIKKPVLIVQGDTDLQVLPDDARRLAAARPDAKLVVLPGVNHVLKIAPAERAANLATYADPNLPLAPGVVDAIARFVREHGA
jgi:hypothetical protein